MRILQSCCKACTIHRKHPKIRVWLSAFQLRLLPLCLHVALQTCSSAVCTPFSRILISKTGRDGHNMSSPCPSCGIVCGGGGGKGGQKLRRGSWWMSRLSREVLQLKPSKAKSKKNVFIVIFTWGQGSRRLVLNPNFFSRLCLRWLL